MYIIYNLCQISIYQENKDNSLNVFLFFIGKIERLLSLIFRILFKIILKQGKALYQMHIISFKGKNREAHLSSINLKMSV